MSGMLLSILFVFGVIIISEVLRKVGKLGGESTRKFIHIGVSHWWLAAMYLIEGMGYALVPPILFVALNFISYKKDLIKSMERGKDISDLGTVYFPISLIIMILLTWPGGLLGGDHRYIGAVGILTMGYGDGFAAIIGGGHGKHKYKVLGHEKSLEGSLAMFCFSFLVSVILMGIYIGFTQFILKICFIIAAIATLAEALTPFGLDNITVPFISALAAYFLLQTAGLPASDFMFRGVIGFAFSFLIAYTALIKNSLTRDGAVGAVLMGTLMYATTGIYGSSIMVLFFISASALSHFKKGDKKGVAVQFEKDGKRDMFQVFANGGVGLIFSMIYSLTENPLYLILVSVAFASANADTWATEIGVLNKHDPISLKTFKRVAKGTSGAVSLLGTLAALGGALVIGMFSAVAVRFSRLDLLSFDLSRIPFLVTLGGFMGSMADSVLGATLQGIFYDEVSEGETERRCSAGKINRLIRGVAYINNDIVNFASIAIASLLTVALI